MSRRRMRVLGIGCLFLAPALWCAVPAGAQTSAPGGEEDNAARVAIERALEAEKAGRDAEAIDWLQKAIAALQKRLAGRVERFIPPPPEGWEADPIEQERAVFGSGEETGHLVQLSRMYRRVDGSAAARLTLTNSPLLVAPQRAMVAMMRNPAYRQMLAQQGVQLTPIDEAPWVGWKQGRPDGGEIVAFAGSYMLRIDAIRGGLAAAEQIWNAVDRKALGRYAEAHSSGK